MNIDFGCINQARNDQSNTDNLPRTVVLVPASKPRIDVLSFIVIFFVSLCVVVKKVKNSVFKFLVSESSD